MTWLEKLFADLRVRVLNCVSNYFLYFAFLSFTLLCFRCGNLRKHGFSARKLLRGSVSASEMPVSVKSAPAAVSVFFVLCRFWMRIYICFSVPVIVVFGAEKSVYIKSPPALDKSPEVCYNNSNKFREIGMRERVGCTVQSSGLLFFISVCLYSNYSPF